MPALAPFSSSSLTRAYFVGPACVAMAPQSILPSAPMASPPLQAAVAAVAGAAAAAAVFLYQCPAELTVVEFVSPAWDGGTHVILPSSTAQPKAAGQWVG